MTKHNETLEALKRMSEEDPNGFSNDILALIDYKCKTAKAEAIKEFAERLSKDYFERVLIRAACDGYGMDNRELVIELSSFLADEVKEMVGDV